MNIGLSKMSIESTPKAVLLIVDDTPAELGELSDFRMRLDLKY